MFSLIHRCPNMAQTDSMSDPWQPFLCAGDKAYACDDSETGVITQARTKYHFVHPKADIVKIYSTYEGEWLGTAALGSGLKINTYKYVKMLCLKETLYYTDLWSHVI